MDAGADPECYESRPRLKLGSRLKGVGVNHSTYSQLPVREGRGGEFVTQSYPQMLKTPRL